MIWVARIGIVVIAIAWKVTDGVFWAMGKFGRGRVVKEAERAQSMARHPSQQFPFAYNETDLVHHHLTPPLEWLEGEEDGEALDPWGEDFRTYYMRDPDNGPEKGPDGLPC